MSEFRATVATVHLRNLQENFARFRSWLKPEAFICPMVKANAYGLGDEAVVRALSEAGARHFGIALVEEGLHLRTVGVQENLLLFGGFSARAARTIIDSRLIPVVGRWAEIEALASELPARAQFPVHLKFNTGMNRLGFASDQVERLGEYFRGQDRLQLSGVCTHLHSGEDILDGAGFSVDQLTEFARVADHFRSFAVVEHALNSVSVMALHKADQEGALPLWGERWRAGARPGIALYGANPCPTLFPTLRPLPVLHWQTEVALVRQLEPGESVSYGARWRAAKRTRLAVLPIGYADGYSRTLGQRSEVLIRGQRVPVVGTVCMDYLFVDLSGLSDSAAVTVGEPVVLAGEQGGEFIGVEELAQFAATIPYEILVGIGQRVPRHYVK